MTSILRNRHTVPGKFYEVTSLSTVTTKELTNIPRANFELQCYLHNTNYTRVLPFNF